MSNAVTPPVRWTSADLEFLPDSEGKRYEIIDGELFVTRSPHVNHQRLIARLWRVLDDWSRQAGQGEALVAPGLVFSEYDNVQPDLVWVSRDRLQGLLDDSGHLTGALELVIEVLSAGHRNQERDRTYKLKLYAVTGVQEYWIADWRSQRIEIYRRDKAQLPQVATLTVEDELTTPLLSGFRVALADLFPRF